MSVPESLSRRQRREATKIFKASKEIVASMPDISPLTPMGAVLEQEDNRVTLERELNRYRSALMLDRNTLHFIRLHSQVGFSEDYLRNIFIDVFSRRKKEVVVNEVVDINRLVKDRGLIINLLNSIIHAPVIYRDEDDKDILSMLDENTDIPIMDLLGEKVRIQTERVDLLDLQVGYLKDIERRARVARHKMKKLKALNSGKVKMPAEVLKVDLPERIETKTPQIQEEPIFEDWQVFWTRRFFSREPNHLINICLSSRTCFLDQLEEISRGQISIRPQSILSAVEFHMRKDILQRALSMRNKYGPEGIKDWVKIKRGNDRIFLLISEEQDENNLIFFAAGRDSIYRRN